MSSSDDDERKKRSINEMFGDDDSDDDSDDQIRPVTSVAPTADASGLFGSDSESDEEDRKPRKKAVSAREPPPSKKAKTSSKKQRGSSEKEAPAKSSRKEERQAGSGDEYDSGDDVVRSKDDDDFIDNDDDLADVMGEYDQEDQRFDDERPLPEDGRGGVGQVEKEEDYFTETMKSLKTGRGRRKMNLSVQEQEQIVQEVLYRMDKAHADDLASIAQRRPALERLKYVDEAIRVLRKQQLQPTFLDFDLLSFIKKWLQPLEDGSLPNLGVRTKLLHLVGRLPVMKEHLKRSGFGKLIMVLWKHPQETRDNKDFCRDLIERWSRAVFDKTLDYSKLAELEAERAENQGFRRPEKRPSSKTSALSRGGDSANPFLGRSNEPREGQIITERAIMPKQLRVDYMHRPQPKLEMQQAAQQKIDAPDGRKARLSKRMQEIARPGRKSKGAVSMSIEGR